MGYWFQEGTLCSSDVQVALLKVLPHKRKIHLNPGLNNDS
jgi:hypothetical protein